MRAEYYCIRGPGGWLAKKKILLLDSLLVGWGINGRGLGSRGLVIVVSGWWWWCMCCRYVTYVRTHAGGG